MTVGQAKLSNLIEKRGSATIALEIGTTQRSIQRWAVQQNRPPSLKRFKMYKMYRIEFEDWDKKATLDNVGE